MAPPKVFISYSHDSDEHKEWVRQLGTKLREKGVDVTLDQWDLGLGDDRILFMEKGVTDSDRVLVICTDVYVEKANARKRGAGYEGYIITAELVENTETDKFIPVIRQVSEEGKTPIFLTPKVYIDFTDDDQFDTSFEQLLREIHGVPLHPRPPLGENPFTNQFSELEVSSHNLLSIPKKVKSASDAYNLAIQLARAGDTLGWQQLVERIRIDVLNSLRQLRQENLHSRNLENPEQRIGIVDKAVNIISPLVSVALAGIKSQNDHFNNQISVLDSLRSINGWHSDFRKEYATGIPNFLGYVYHSLYGSISLHTNQLPLALDLARLKVPIVSSPESQHNMVWKITTLMGWSQAISLNGTDNWKYLMDAYERWEWLHDMFECESTYHISLVAYYMALSIHELATQIDLGREIGLDEYGIRVRFDFLFEKYEIKQRAALLLRHNSSLPELWTCLGVTQDQMRSSWRTWIERYEHLFWRSYQDRLLFLTLTKHPPQYLNFFDAL